MPPLGNQADHQAVRHAVSGRTFRGIYNAEAAAGAAAYVKQAASVFHPLIYGINDRLYVRQDLPDHLGHLAVLAVDVFQ